MSYSIELNSMASSSSWWQSLFSPAKNAFTTHCFKRLQEYANLKMVKSSQEHKALASLNEMENIIGYKFKNKLLLQQAFTHPSYQESESYERLEYVGDSILNFLISKQQFFTYPNLSPGSLTALRAANVDTEKLARVAVKYNFHNYLQHENPVLSKQIRVFIKAIEKYPFHSYGLIDAPKTLADVVESTIGAIYVDSNSSVDTTWEVAKILLEPMITPEMLQQNPVRKLNELCHKKKLKIRFRDKWSKQGVYEIFIDNQLKGKGVYKAKKEIALNRAAEEACNNIINDMSTTDNVIESLE
ncbi:ribonuclease 3-like protein 3 [Bidens hawaiensis]|uniref:ribonuclease 3-like protein 3 n=1 Tax=Bidens hawaiensis TaxID=980011 RepID=UPI004049B474